MIIRFKTPLNNVFLCQFIKIHTMQMLFLIRNANLVYLRFRFETFTIQNLWISKLPLQRFVPFLSIVLLDQISCKLLKVVLLELLRKSSRSLWAAITNFGRNVDTYNNGHVKLLGVVYISILKRPLKKSEFRKSRFYILQHETQNTSYYVTSIRERALKNSICVTTFYIIHIYTYI